MYKKFLKFFLTVASATLITNDLFAFLGSSKDYTLGIPNDFIYKGKIISPHCIIERESDIIDLEKCRKELDSKRAYYDDGLREIIKPYEIISDANEISVTKLSITREDGLLKKAIG